ncbi:phosphoglycerate dehydrogenase [Peribacillus cavernae]|uniref:D-3-phosphoglycerate dehydrogenase n=1 Tax=Peribacillus cavernae TaxID=1674310 RepID=A0A433HLL7_9BACI|nr:phosphoglycerate dehydrogenase [Peribacillus cavernae]MDQ0219026.1 D-3-phosphoglycerate dehydrogenase [Peribacillus cavernae]RUQ29268.1 phosphoglycerate dehydrogenase [Peribacillus cavernae]
MYRILVADAIKPEGLEPLLQASEIELIQKKIEEAEESLHEFDALLVRSATKVTEELIEKMPNLKIIARAGVGVDNIDVPAATKHGIVVVNAPDGNTISTAEHTFAMMAALARHIPQGHSSVKNGEWKRSAFTGTELYGKKLGIVGMGRIGGEIAKRAKVFGMDVLVFDPFLTSDRAKKLNVTSLSLEELLPLADIITVHTPLTSETKGLLNKDNLRTCKKGVYLLNCARGGIIDEDDLYELLLENHVAGAALDVFVEEPPAGNKLLELDSVITTPHLGASTKEAQFNVATQVAQEVLVFLEGNPVANSINLPAISKEQFEKVQPYYQLVKQMGSIGSQCMKEGINEISVTYGGEAFHFDTSILTKSLISGVFKTRLDGPVNEVNALLIAKERGVTIGEKISTDAYGYANCISVTVKGDNRQLDIRGTHVENYGSRIVSLNGFNIEFLPEGNFLYIQHTDQPGVIGNVGRILGDDEVNIATMQVGRKQAGGEAIMVLSFDKPLSDEMFEKLNELPDISFMYRMSL